MNIILCVRLSFEYFELIIIYSISIIDERVFFYLFPRIFYHFVNLCPHILDLFSSRFYRMTFAFGVWMPEKKKQNANTIRSIKRAYINRNDNCIEHFTSTQSQNSKFTTTLSWQLTSEIKNYHLPFFLSGII